MSVSRVYIRNTSLDDFDPNAPEAGESLVWAIFDGHRFRTWSQRGHAVSALRRAYQAKLYEMGPNGKWELRAYKTTKTPTVCADCGKTTLGPGERYDYQTHTYVPTGNTVNHGRWGFERAGKTKLALPLNYAFRCKDCAEDHA